MAKDKDEKTEPVEAKAEPTPEEAAAKGKKRRLLLFAVGGAALAVGVGVGLFFVLGGSGSKTASKTDAPAAEQKTAETTPKDAGKAEAKDGDKKADGAGEAKADEKKPADDAKKDDAKTADAKTGDAKTADAKTTDTTDAIGCTYNFPAFHMNLGNPLENHYIRLEVAVATDCDKGKKEVEDRKDQLKDAIISVTRRKTREFLLGPDGMEQLRKEIETSINQRMDRPINAVYITDILIE